MKTNVDLTANQTFTTFTYNDEILKFLKFPKPWEEFRHEGICRVDNNEEFKRHNVNRIFAVGNRKERQIWKENYEYDTNQVCDRCGRRRDKKPWVNNRCDCYSMIYKPRIPWKI